MPSIKNPAIRERNAMRIFGCGEVEAIALNDGLRLREPRSKAMRYYCQQQSAKKRGIGWEITFSDWLKVWVDSGFMDRRGIGRAGYCMARHGDTGPYKPGNVSIKTCVENSREGIEVARPAMRSGNKHLIARLGTGRGWTYDARCKNRPYTMQCTGVKAQRFATQAEAEAAYKAAVAERFAAIQQVSESTKSGGVCVFHDCN